MTRSASDQAGDTFLGKRLPPLLIAGFLGIVLVAFLRGIRDDTGIQRPPKLSQIAPVGEIPPAPRYDQIPGAEMKPNAHWTSHFADLDFDKPGLFDQVVRTPEMKNVALFDRATRRAYDGAPPVVPHPVVVDSGQSCLLCHKEGLRLGSQLATRMSHPAYSTCTQCHVESDRRELPVVTEPVANGFVGMQRSGPGTRALFGAPPTIPHHLWMRQDCMSCHGLVARPGIRTTHPWLQNCLQCHVPDAEIERRDWLRLLASIHPSGKANTPPQEARK